MCVFEDKRLQRTVKGRQGKAVGFPIAGGFAV
jgi:hypothetical protein